MKLLNFFAARKNETKVPEIAENGADKVLFKSEQNSNVRKRYMNFASAQKRAVDAPLYAISGGRSMVEMLGVLAIIGVLSVGAIAGYSKAMMKYKLNKQTEQITQIVSALVEHKSVFNSAVYHESLIPLFIKLNAVPKEMIKPDVTLYIYDVFNIRIWLWRQINPDLMQLEFSMDNHADNNHDICRNIVESLKGYKAELHALGINATNADDVNTQSWYYGEQNSDNVQKTIQMLDIKTMQNLCEICDKNRCGIYAAFPIFS